MNQKLICCNSRFPIIGCTPFFLSSLYTSETYHWAIQTTLNFFVLYPTMAMTGLKTRNLNTT